MLFRRVVDFFGSLKLTVVCLSLSLVLVFLGTMAQEPLGLYAAQNRFFRTFFVDGNAFYAGLHKVADMLMQSFGHPLQPLNAQALLSAPRIPVFPGGYLLGGVLLLNLIVVSLERFSFSAKKAGIWLVHCGLILLFVGQLTTDMFSVEGIMHLREGETRNYSERPREAEVAITDTSVAGRNRVVAVPEERLRQGGRFSLPGTPLTVEVRKYYRNAQLARLPADKDAQAAATQGAGRSILVTEVAPVTTTDRRNVPATVIELFDSKGSLGTWLLSEYLEQPQTLVSQGRTYQLAMRPRRDYKPFSLTLLDFKHDVYPGTDIPKNFSSRVRLQRPSTGEDREVLIYMNNPLRYDGLTFYQASFDTDNLGSVLQVVRNPSRLIPYISCILVATGLMVQFLIHLIPFLKRKVQS